METNMSQYLNFSEEELKKFTRLLPLPLRMILRILSNKKYHSDIKVGEVIKVTTITSSPYALLDHTFGFLSEHSDLFASTIIGDNFGLLTIVVKRTDENSSFKYAVTISQKKENNLVATLKVPESGQSELWFSLH